MTPQIKQWVAQCVATGRVPRQGEILEIGSRNVNGGVRELFDPEHYFGVDMHSGPGVDWVGDATKFLELRRPDQYDLVICLETLEHVPRFWEIIGGVRRVLKPDGAFLVSVPTTGFPEHRFPVDCYRFMADAFAYVFFEGMRIMEINTVKDDLGFPCLVGLGRKL